MDQNKETTGGSAPTDTEVKSIIREVIQEYMDVQRSKAEPAYKAELAEERKRREQLEHRLNELVEENQRSRQRAEEAERGAAIRSELQRLGVSKVDLAFRVVKDDILRGEDGQLKARTPTGEAPLRDYLAQFVNENPELLPARVAGGSGATTGHRSNQGSSVLEIEKIRPGMSAEEKDRVREEIRRIASQHMRGS